MVKAFFLSSATKHALSKYLFVGRVEENETSSTNHCRMKNHHWLLLLVCYSKADADVVIQVRSSVEYKADSTEIIEIIIRALVNLRLTQTVCFHFDNRIVL